MWRLWLLLEQTFRRKYRLHHQGDKNRRSRNVSTNYQQKHPASCQLILTLFLARRIVTLMLETIRSSETSVLTRTTRSRILEDGILHSHRRDNLKSYKKNPPVFFNMFTVLRACCTVTYCPLFGKGLSVAHPAPKLLDHGYPRPDTQYVSPSPSSQASGPRI
jgi:hypothetical protein